MREGTNDHEPNDVSLEICARQDVLTICRHLSWLSNRELEIENRLGRTWKDSSRAFQKSHKPVPEFSEIYSHSFEGEGCQQSSVLMFDALLFKSPIQ